MDSAIVVKLVVQEADSAYWASLVDGQILFSSEVGLTECFSALLRKEREGAVTPSQRKVAWRHVERDVDQGRINLVTVSREVLFAADTILVACHPRIALRSLDAIHLASAQRCQSWPLVANDARMRAGAERLGIPVAPLP